MGKRFLRHQQRKNCYFYWIGDLERQLLKSFDFLEYYSQDYYKQNLDKIDQLEFMLYALFVI